MFDQDDGFNLIEHTQSKKDLLKRLTILYVGE